LETARSQKVRHTDILSRASLSHIPFKQYLTLLVRNGLIEYFLNERTCRTTDKGLHFLYIFNEMRNLVSPSVLWINPEGHGLFSFFASAKLHNITSSWITQITIRLWLQLSSRIIGSFLSTTTIIKKCFTDNAITIIVL
jgi:predicted transcriptional regulator